MEFEFVGRRPSGIVLLAPLLLSSLEFANCLWYSWEIGWDILSLHLPAEEGYCCMTGRSGVYFSCDLPCGLQNEAEEPADRY